MHNPILRTTLLLTLFWWAIWFIVYLVFSVPEAGWDWEKLKALVTLEDWRTMLLGYLAIVVLFGLVFGLETIERHFYAGKLKRGGRARGILSTLGPVPGYRRLSVSNKAPNLGRWPQVKAWCAQADPVHRQTFLEILGLLYTHAQLPASVEGGHGGRMLWEHSLNVVETGLQLIEAGWTYEGRKNHPLSGQALYSHERSLAVLILISHDLGKLKAYVLNKKGAYEKDQRFEEHDRYTPRFLAQLETPWLLDEDERRALFTATAYEHHPQALPKDTSERVRLLMLFLKACDKQASEEEEGKRDALEPGSQPAESPASSDEDEANEAAERSARRQTMWRWFLDSLAKPSTINGRSKTTRWGFKRSDGWLVLNEHTVREALANECLQDPSQGAAKRGDGTYPLTLELLDLLGEKGVVVCEWKGLRFKPTSALWRAEAARVKRDPVSGEVVERKVLATWNAAILLDMGEHAPKNLIELEPAKHPPEIIAPVFPQRALKSAPPDPSAVPATTQASADEHSGDEPPAASKGTEITSEPAAVPSDEDTEPTRSVSAEPSAVVQTAPAEVDEAASASASPIKPVVGDQASSAPAESEALQKAANQVIEAAWDWNPPELPDGGAPMAPMASKDLRASTRKPPPAETPRVPTPAAVQEPETEPDPREGEQAQPTPAPKPAPQPAPAPQSSTRGTTLTPPPSMPAKNLNEHEVGVWLLGRLWQLRFGLIDQPLPLMAAQLLQRPGDMKDQVASCAQLLKKVQGNDIDVKLIRRIIGTPACGLPEGIGSTAKAVLRIWLRSDEPVVTPGAKALVIDRATLLALLEDHSAPEVQKLCEVCRDNNLEAFHQLLQEEQKLQGLDASVDTAGRFNGLKINLV